MPLRDHFRPPLSEVSSWEEVHGQWPAVIVQHLGKTSRSHSIWKRATSKLAATCGSPELPLLMAGVLRKEIVCDPEVDVFHA